MEENQQKVETPKPNNNLLYAFIATTALALGYVGYVYSAFDLIKKGELSKEYVLKAGLEFKTLPEHVQSRYIEFFEHKKQLDELNKKIELSTKKDAKENEPKVVEKIVEKIVKVPVERIVEVEKIVKVRANIDDEIESSTQVKKSNLKFNTYTCKTMDSGSIKVSQYCQKNLLKFLEKNKDSKMFEVIGMVDDKDFTLINALRDVYGDKRIKHLAKYSQIGLSRQRVIEASWLVRRHIGNYKKIKTVNYMLKSKDKKGFVVRAYK